MKNSKIIKELEDKIYWVTVMHWTLTKAQKVYIKSLEEVIKSLKY